MDTNDSNLSLTNQQITLLEGLKKKIEKGSIPAEMQSQVYNLIYGLADSLTTKAAKDIRKKISAISEGQNVYDLPEVIMAILSKQQGLPENFSGEMQNLFKEGVDLEMFLRKLSGMTGHALGNFERMLGDDYKAAQNFVTEEEAKTQTETSQPDNNTSKKSYNKVAIMSTATVLIIAMLAFFVYHNLDVKTSNKMSTHVSNSGNKDVSGNKETPELKKQADAFGGKFEGIKWKKYDYVKSHRDGVPGGWFYNSVEGTRIIKYARIPIGKSYTVDELKAGPCKILMDDFINNPKANTQGLTLEDFLEYWNPKEISISNGVISTTRTDGTILIFIKSENDTSNGSTSHLLYDNFKQKTNNRQFAGANMKYTNSKTTVVYKAQKNKMYS